MKTPFFSAKPPISSFLLLAALLPAVWGCRQTAFPSDETAQSLLSTFELEPGFQIELVAIEPLVADPVAMEIDEYGRFYVVEMHGYPLDKSGTGKVKLLSDTNGDGRMDQSTIFADSLLLPTGIMRWKKGVLVTDAPNVLYLEDTDGDGRADRRDTVLTGFAVSNPQHNFNTPLYGLDNWVYLGHEGPVTANVYEDEFGDRGSDIRFAGRPDSPRLSHTANGRNVRFRPDSYELEALSGRTQFGHTFTAYGSHLLVSNAHHLFQEMIAARYLRRNPFLLVPDATRSLPDHGDAAEIFPITQDPEHQLLTDVGVMTSACGLTAYQGGTFPAAFDSVVFVAEPVHNLIHADRLSGQGSSFRASRLRPDREFLASTDAWFRPVHQYIGPDGALYVLDYHRQIVEHPEWMAEEVTKSGALYNGTDQGRIYRITPTGTPTASWPRGLRLGDASGEELVEKLADPNIWWRRHAQRLLLDRNDPQVVPALLRQAKNLASPLGRLHALWTLEGMGQLRSELISQALRDPVAGLRENAIRLAELHLTETPELAGTLLALHPDPDPKVAYQLLCTLGFVDTPRAAQVRQELLFGNLKDEWVQVAALSARSSEEGALLAAVIERFEPEVPAYASLVRRLSAMAAARQRPGAVSSLLRKGTGIVPEAEGKWQAAILEGLAQGLKKETSGVGEEDQEELMRAFFGHPAAPVRQASLRVLQVTGLSAGPEARAAEQKAAQLAQDRQAPAGRRAEAVRFLTLGAPASHAALLQGLLEPREPLPVQLAALEGLSAIPDETVSRTALQKWPVLTPELREAALSTFMTRPERIRLLLDALEQNHIQPASLGWRRSVRLMTQSDDGLRNRARALLGEQEGHREATILQYQPVLNMTADQAKGKVVFERNCAVCHQIAGQGGVAFGPDLAPIKNRRPAAIMSDILDPNQSIADGYDLWEVTLAGGNAVQGIIAAETPTSLTLRSVAGLESTIARQDIRSVRALGLSAMPSGLEKQISQQEMADLLAFIRQAR